MRPAACDGHPDIARVEVGSIGWWGEWHLSHSRSAQVPRVEHRRKVIDAYLAAVPRTPLMMPKPANDCIGHAVTRGVRWRADSLGDLGSFSPTWNHMRGTYRLAIGVTAVAEEKPVMRLAIAGRPDDGWYPLGHLEIVP